MNKKNNIVFFIDRVIHFLNEKEPIHREKELFDDNDELNKEVFVFELPNKNRFTVKVPLHWKEHISVFTVWGRFDVPCSVGNRFSGKYNFLSCSDHDTAVKEFIDMFEKAFGVNSGKPIEV